MLSNFLDFHLTPHNREVRDISPFIQISVFLFFKKPFQFLIIIEYLVKINHIILMFFAISGPTFQFFILRFVFDVIDDFEDVFAELHVFDVFNFLDLLGEVVLHL